MPTARPRIDGVLETVLYFEDQSRTRKFYSEILGFRLIDQEPGRSLFYRAGQSVFLLFRADRTRESERLPPHGASGTIHTCFVAPPEDYEAWKAYLTEQGVVLLKEVQWSRGKTFYFHDPDGNVLEIANADIWPD